jgi:hypothetical protein
MLTCNERKTSKTHAWGDRNIAQNAHLYLPENNAKCTPVVTGKHHKIHACNDKKKHKNTFRRTIQDPYGSYLSTRPFSEGKIFTNNAYFIIATAGRSA